MKIIIEHAGLKRAISGTGFNICASPEDLRTIAEAITRADMQGYGWLQIRDQKPDDHAATPGTKPLAWSTNDLAAPQQP